MFWERSKHNVQCPHRPDSLVLHLGCVPGEVVKVAKLVFTMMCYKLCYCPIVTQGE